MNKLKALIGDSPKKWAIFTFGAYFLVVMHYFQFNHGGSGLNHPMNPLGWIVVSIIIACGLLQISRSGEFRYNILSRNLSIACFILLIPLLYSGDTGWYSHQRLLGLFAGLALLFSIQQFQFKRKDYFTIFAFIMVAVLIESILGLVQYYILPLFPEFNLTSTRPTALLFQANVAASFYVIGLSLSLMLLQRAAKNKGTLHYLCSTTALTCSTAIILVQSRTGLIAAIMITLLLLTYRSANNKKWLLTVAIGALIAIASINALDRFSRDQEVYTHPGLRIQIYTDTLELIVKKPLIGHGYGSFAPAYLAHQAKKIQKKQQERGYFPAYRMTHPHNEVLLWVMEGGIASFIAILIIVFTIISVIISSKKQKLLICALLFPLAFHTMTEFPFYQSVATWCIFIIFLSFSQQSTQSATFSTSKASVYKLSGALLVFLTTSYMLSILVSQHRTAYAIDNPQSPILLNTPLPFRSDTFIERQNQQKLTIAMQRNVHSEVNNYLQWAKRINHVAPQAARFKNQILAALYLRKYSEAQRSFAQAKNLYPTLDWAQQADWLKRSKN